MSVSQKPLNILNRSSTPTVHAIKRRYFFIGGVIAFLMIFTYVWVYIFYPFADLTNLLILDGLTALSSLMCAVLLTRTARFFQRGELPRLIWVCYAACIWLWALAEIVWGYYNITVGEVPSFTIADAFWFFGYVVFTVSIVRQYRLVYFSKSNWIRAIAVIAWFMVLLTTRLITELIESEMPVEDFILYFYPVVDFAIGIAALFLVYKFRGATLALPWLTFLGYVFTDGFYVWATTTGFYDWQLRGFSISLLMDASYLVAYLIMGWGAMQQYLLLKYGPDLPNASAQADG